MRRARKEDDVDACVCSPDDGEWLSELVSSQRRWKLVDDPVVRCLHRLRRKIISHFILSLLVHISCRRVISFECCLIIMAYPYYVYNLSEAWREFSSPKPLSLFFLHSKRSTTHFKFIKLLPFICFVSLHPGSGKKAPRKKEIEYTRELAVHEHILSN